MQIRRMRWRAARNYACAAASSPVRLWHAEAAEAPPFTAARVCVRGACAGARVHMARVFRCFGTSETKVCRNAGNTRMVSGSRAMSSISSGFCSPRTSQKFSSSPHRLRDLDYSRSQSRPTELKVIIDFTQREAKADHKGVGYRAALKEPQ